MSSSNVLAIIPARGGSKRVPGKNLRKVGGISLVGRSILSACQSKHVTHVVVTTDHADIKEEAYHWFSQMGHHHKVMTVLNRPVELADDHCPLDDVIVWTTKAMMDRLAPIKFSKVVTLQPTSPLRALGLVDKCIEALESPINSVLTVHDAGHFFWAEERSHPTVKLRYQQVNAPGRPNSQDIPAASRLWAENGSVYVTDTYALLNQKTRLAFHTMIVPIPMPHAVDIDTEEDFQLAERLAPIL